MQWMISKVILFSPYLKKTGTKYGLLYCFYL
nr:MAG TPA: hypothetical protein [Caudoviricetes sp.]